MNFEWFLLQKNLINTSEKLESLAGIIKNCGITKIGLDIEGESNLHRYGIHICLIQLRIEDKIYIIDPITIKDISSLKSIFEDEKICKVMFCAEFDVKLLKHSSGIQLRNIFDVQAGFKILGYARLGLENIVSEVLNVDNSHKLKKQKSDWNKRPLSDDQLKYAENDVKYLFELENYLNKNLNDEQKEILKIKNLQLEKCDIKEKKNPHLQIKGSGNLNYQQKNVLKHLYNARDIIARKIDFPPFWVIKNEDLIKIAIRKNISPDSLLKNISIPKRAMPLMDLIYEAFIKAEDEYSKKTSRIK